EASRFGEVGESAARDTRMDAHKTTHRSRYEVPLSVDRRILLTHQYSSGRKPQPVREHETGIEVHHRNLPDGLLCGSRRATYGKAWSVPWPSAAGTGDRAQSITRMSMGTMRDAQDSPRLAERRLYW